MHTLLQVADRIGYPAAGLGIFIEGVGIPFPGETMLLVVAAYAGAGHLAIPIVIVCGFLGAALGADAGYAIGWYGGRPVVERIFAWLRVKPERIAQTEAFFARHGAKAMFGARFIVGARSYGSMLAGMARMPFPAFQLYSAAGSVAWAVLIGLLGYFLGGNLPLLERVVRDAGIALLLVLVAAAGVTFLLVRRGGRRT